MKCALQLNPSLYLLCTKVCQSQLKSWLSKCPISTFFPHQDRTTCGVASCSPPPPPRIPLSSFRSSKGKKQRMRPSQARMKTTNANNPTSLSPGESCPFDGETTGAEAEKLAVFITAKNKPVPDPVVWSKGAKGNATGSGQRIFLVFSLCWDERRGEEKIWRLFGGFLNYLCNIVLHFIRKLKYFCRTAVRIRLYAFLLACYKADSAIISSNPIKNLRKTLCDVWTCVAGYLLVAFWCSYRLSCECSLFFLEYVFDKGLSWYAIILNAIKGIRPKYQIKRLCQWKSQMSAVDAVNLLYHVSIYTCI